MIDPTLVLFLGSVVAVMAVPGPSVVFAMARTVEGGRAAGLVSVLGLEAGLTVHVLAAATGLAAVMHSSDVAFVAVRYVGAGYLLVMGLRQLVGPGGASSAPALTDRQPGGRWHPGRIFRQACMVDLLNPGTILFLAAYLPQFVDTGPGASGTQLLGLGAVVVAVATLCDVAWVLGTAEVVARVRRRRSTPNQNVPGVHRAVGLVYLGLATPLVVG